MPCPACFETAGRCRSCGARHDRPLRVERITPIAVALADSFADDYVPVQDEWRINFPHTTNTINNRGVHHHA